MNFNNFLDKSQKKFSVYFSDICAYNTADFKNCEK